MKKKNIVKLIVLFLILSVQSAYAFYGARPMGMGEAFTAIADDANAGYYNPAGVALNPGIEIAGSTRINNRNTSVGDNIAAVKMCFETEMNPFIWIMGIGAASLAAFEGAKYLSDTGVVKKGWGRKGEKKKKSDSLAKDVKKKGSKKVRDTKKIAKEKAKDFAKKAAKKTAKTAVAVGKEAAHAAKEGFLLGLRNPWYYHNYYRPSYWDRREPEGKAQFALGLTWVFDKNPAQDQNTNIYSLSLASGYEERIALGANVNIYDVEIPSIKTKGFGGGLDIGAIARPLDQIAFGVAAKELLTTDVHFDNGSSITYGMNVNGGVALIPIPELTLAADMHNIFEQNGNPATMHYGVEVRPIGGVALRGGLSNGSKTAGIGFAIGPFILEYAYLGGAFNRTQLVGASWKI